jgi:hypothetical protein
MIPCEHDVHTAQQHTYCLCTYLHLHFLLWHCHYHLLLLVHNSLLTPASTTSSTSTSPPCTPNLSHTTDRGKHGWRLWQFCVVVELLLLLNTEAVLHILSLKALLKFLLCWLLLLLLLYNMASDWVVYYRLGFYSVAIHNCCNCIALWGV